jgi:uncharacterized membrane protein
MELLILLFCAGGLLVILAVGAWVLINKSKLEGRAEDRNEISEELERLESDFTSGALNSDEYHARRREIERGQREHER